MPRPPFDKLTSLQKTSLKSEKCRRQIKVKSRKMQLLKPSWVSADGHALMSIDVHPDGTRFATGGQGTDCGRVCIWNLKPILDAEAAKDKSVHKLLTQVCLVMWMSFSSLPNKHANAIGNLSKILMSCYVLLGLFRKCSVVPFCMDY